MKDFHHLHQISNEMCKLSKKIATESYSYYKSKLQSSVHFAHIAGSLAEVSISSRLFLPSKEKADLSNFEADIELTYAEVPSSFKHCVKELGNKPGFIHFQILFENCFCPSCFKHRNNSSKMDYMKVISESNGLLMASQIKNRGFRSLQSYKIAEAVRIIVSVILNKPNTSITITNIFHKPTKATYALNFEVGFDDIFVKLSLDLSFIIKIDWIPDFTCE